MRNLLLMLFCAMCLPTFAQDPAPPQHRLGDAAAPLAYAVRWSIDPRQATFEGEVRIELRVARAAPVLWLNAEQLEIERAEFVIGERRVPARVVTGSADFVGFAIEGGFPAGDAVAEIRFRGPIEGVATRGLFRQKEGGEWYVVSQFEALSARRALPCFDEPGWKTPWQVTIDAPAADVAVSNTPEVSLAEVPGRAGWQRRVFARTRPLPSYLVAVAVGPYELVEGGRAGALPTPLRYAAPKGRGAEARFARESTPELLKLLEDYFGTPYPFEKLDSVTIPSTFGFGAMENVGMVTYSSEILLASPERESIGFRRRYASIASHEIAHMWFGNLVTLAWWDDIWLNEAFATWAARKNLRAYRPEWAGGWRDGDRRRRALNADRLMSARRIANPVTTKGDVSGAFDQITYSKGGEVLSMFEAWLGPERFRTGVRNFLKTHAYGSATSLDFFRAIGDASGRGDAAVAAFRSFVDQPGLPMMDVDLACDAGTASIEVVQRRFKPLGAEGPEMQWTTPACFRYHADGKLHTQCAEVSGRQTIRLDAARSCPDWVVGNAEGAGHWIARYRTPAVKSLAARAAALPEAEAVALSFDTALLANAGLITRDDSLLLTEGLLRHPSLGVRQGVVEYLEPLQERWLTAAQRERVRAMATRTLLPLAREMGWRERPGDDIKVQDMRTALLPFASALPGAGDLRMEARRLALAWIDDRKAVAASTLAPVLATAARFADGATYGRMEQALLGSTDRFVRNELLKALAVVREPALRERALALLLQAANGRDAIDGREAFQLIESAFLDEHNLPAAFAFARERWDRVVAKLPADSVARVVRRLPGLCTAADREAFTRLLKDSVPRHLGAQLAYDQSLEAIDICLAVNARRAAPRKASAPAPRSRQ